MTSIVQEQQNQKILNFAESNFSSQTHEYGRHDMSGRLANKKTGERMQKRRRLFFFSLLFFRRGMI